MQWALAKHAWHQDRSQGADLAKQTFQARLGGGLQGSYLTLQQPQGTRQACLQSSQLVRKPLVYA